MEMNPITQPVPTPASYTNFTTEMLVVIGAFTVLFGSANWDTLYNGTVTGSTSYNISFGRLTERVHIFIWEGPTSIEVSSWLHSDLGGHNRKCASYGLEENLEAVRSWIRFFDI